MTDSDRQESPPERADVEDLEHEFHAEDVLDKPFDRGLTKRLLRYVIPYRRLVVLSLLLILTSTGLALLAPIFVKEAIDGPLASGDAIVSPGFAWLGELFRLPMPGDASDDNSGRGSWLILIVVVYATSLALQFIVRYLQAVVMNRTGQSVMRDLRVELFAHLQRQSVSYYQKNPVGRLVTRVTSDVEALNELFTSGVVNLFGDLLTIVGIAAIMFYYNPTLALIALSVSPLLAGVTFLFRTMARKHYREIRRRIAFLSSYTQESITGLGIIRMFGQQESRARGYETINEGYLIAYLRSIFWYAIFFPSVEILSVVALALVLVYSAGHIDAGTLRLGDFFLFWIYLQRFFEPVRDLAEKYNVLQAAMASSERIFGILDHDDTLESGTTPVTELESKIRFEDVSFGYDPDKPVLRGVSFDVAKGETVALVGATGAGKSTVVNLLLRFYDPSSGRITIDGVDIREVELDAHRQRFGLVLQDVSVFTRSVRENIDLDRDLPRAAIEAASRDVNVQKFVNRLEGGLDAPMRERGESLSSGERQLLSFARALAGQPDVLVLDEATSHIDTNTEELIQEALDKLVTGRTSVIIAHRLSTIRSADRILVFHHGELREQGNHRALMDLNGIYARLYRLQFAGTQQ